MPSAPLRVERSSSANFLDNLIGCLAAFTLAGVANARASSVSEVARAGLRLLKERETQVEALRAAIIAGDESGASTIVVALAACYRQ